MNKQKIIKELKSWGIIVSVFGVLYFTGLHVEVFGFIQRLTLATGLRNADADTEERGRYGSTDYKWMLQDYTTGEKVNLEEFKGKTVFLNVWATWCPPCVAEMPSIEGLYQKLKDNEDIVFVMLSVDEKPENVGEFMKRKKFTFPVYQEITSTPSVFQTRSIPTTFVFDKNGEIIFKHTGIANYDTEDFVKMLTSH
ncbi:redoxin family protein [Flammeovirga yaeyamensis]|uniref:Redoxin family protein n=1 Tax=Flammeovirga yaeyamensis TaxID=367791 RepID=A0AAX1N892_9BACT|nr:TlpA disulfide reductase family protein [Flammeovirga yaeyamensis]MBB3700593.1 thiol-disulfide isomerase/thioredoxin [Flammeovirga yaeyamensis]NMF37709.1 TlpA family protein disulfide reductase [Flammeovirga yaeyamensis]QWG02018.1 redoxin family protein [Flammeovirga yaeyamensis]